MNGFFSVSIRAQLALLAALVALPAAALIAFSGLELRRDALRQARAQTQQLADSIASQQQNLTAGAQQLILALAQLDRVRAGDPEVRPILAEILRLNPQYSNLFVADRTGRIWVSAVGVPPFDVSDRRYFRRAVATGQLSSGEYVVSRATGAAAFNLGYPIRDERGDVAGVISVGFALGFYQHLLQLSKLPASASYALLDHRGVVLSSVLDPRASVGQTYDPDAVRAMRDGPEAGTAVERLRDGGERIAAYRTLRLAGEPAPYMYVRAAIPVKAILASADRELVRNLALFLSFLLLALVFAFLVAKRSILDRVALLEQASRSLARGDLDARVSDLVVGGELGSLARTFDSMARQLASREAALVESERNYREIFDATKEAIFVLEPESGRILQANGKAAQMFGYSRDELLAALPLQLGAADPPASLGTVRAWIRRALEQGPHSFEWRARRKDGEAFWAEASLSGATLGGAPRVLAVVRDVTGRKDAEAENRRLQDMLTQAQKFESIGRLAGGVAHDFNNLLIGILGYAEFLEEGIRAGRPSLEDLAEIRKAGERARELTAQLLAVARRQVVAPRALDLDALVRDSEKLLRRILGEDVRLTADLSPEPCTVKADPGQLQQVLLNLAVNARDAMPRGGALVIATRNAEVDARDASRRPGIEPGRYAILSVTDSGEGMSAETLAHLFEPFFTTKGPGRGTGLGLATVYGIVKQAGGHVSVRSEPGRGTTFEIHLPRTTEAQAPAPAPAARPARPGDECVLLVEDDGAARELSLRALQGAGYQVLVARNGREALEAWTGARRPVDLLVTDVVMPEMSGRELADALTRRQPSLRVLFVSGYTQDAMQGHGPLDPDVDLLPKPFTPSALLSRVREVLDA